jgi:hypothetical protein
VRIRPVLAALAVALLAVGVAVRSGTPPSRSPRVLEVLNIGGNLTDAVLAGDFVWVADSTGRRVVQVDATSRRVIRRTGVAGQPVAITGHDSAVWVRTAVGAGGAVQPVVGGRAVRVGFGSALASNADSVWAADVERPPEGIHRIDAATERDAGRLPTPGVYALAEADRALWAVTNNGTALRLDGRTGRVRARWPAIAASAGTAAPPLVADAGGAWVMRVGQGSDSRAIRLEGDRVARRLHLDPATVSLLAQGPDGLWTATADAYRGRSAVVRLDPRTGKVTARVPLGDRNVTGLVPVGHDVWALAGDGTITVVGA